MIDRDGAPRLSVKIDGFLIQLLKPCSSPRFSTVLERAAYSIGRVQLHTVQHFHLAVGKASLVGVNQERSNFISNGFSTSSF